MNNLIYLSNSILFSRKANSIQVIKMCNALSKHINVTLYSYKLNNKLSIDDFYGIKSNFNSIEYFFSTNKFLKNINPLLVLIRNLSVKKNTIIFSRNRIGSFFGIFLKFNLIYEVHNLPRGKINTIIESLILKSIFTKKVIFISDALREYYLNSNLLIKSQNNSVILHDAADYKKKPKQNKKKPEIGYVGHLYKGRGIELIIKVAKKFPNLNFHLVGGETEDIERVKKIASKNIIIHGFKKPSEVGALRDKFGILLMPYKPGLSDPNSSVDTSRWMSPLKLFEYMSSASAIISTDLPVLREILNEQNSILVPYEQKAWEEKINLLVNNEKLRFKLGENAYNDFVCNFTWEIRAEKILKIIKQ